MRSTHALSRISRNASTALRPTQTIYSDSGSGTEWGSEPIDFKDKPPNPVVTYLSRALTTTDPGVSLSQISTDDPIAVP